MHWIPCISSNFSRVPGVTSTWGTTFATTTWVTLTPLVIVIGAAVRFFTITTTCLLPEITLVYVFITCKPQGKWGLPPPFGDWVITCTLFPRSRVFVQPCIILDKKTSTSSFFVHFDHLVQVSQIHCLACDSLPTSQQSSYPESIQGNWWPIYFTFLDHVDDLIDGGCTQSNWYSGSEARRVWCA